VRGSEDRVRNRRFLIAAAVAALYGSAGSAHADEMASKADPAEKVNRVGYAIHQFFDRHLIRPIAMTYQTVVPGLVRDGLRHVLDNLGEPNIVANDLMQGRVKMARTATLRFATNSTFGVLGVFDMATRAGLPRHENGFDLTLGRYGMKPGAYLFVPLLGPTTVRDAIGSAVNTLLDPVHAFVPHHANTFIVTKGVVDGVDQRARADSQLTAIMSDATDPYATLRSVYLQNEQSKIDDNGTALPALPDFDEDATPAKPSTPPAPKTGLNPSASGAS
jgi:phospholipid-binding lipoprotein MlaA